MTITEALADSGVVVNHYNKPKSPPTKDGFARIISACRDAEGLASKELAKANKDTSAAHLALFEMTEKLQKAEARILKYELAEKLEADEYQSISAAGKKNLLEVTN